MPDDRILWTLIKNGHVARAIVRDVPGVGSELRYLLDGDLRASTVYRDGSELAAMAKQAELEANGWLPQLPPMWGTDAGHPLARRRAGGVRVTCPSCHEVEYCLQCDRCHWCDGRAWRRIGPRDRSRCILVETARGFGPVAENRTAAQRRRDGKRLARTARTKRG